MSYHSHKGFDWIKALLSGDEDKLVHKFGAIFNYILDLDMNDLYEYCSNEGEVYMINRTKIDK